MKNLKFKADNGRGVVLPLNLSTVVTSGQVLQFGTAGLYGIAETDSVTDALIAVGRAPQGLRKGQASVVLPQVGSVYDLGPLPSGMADGDKVWANPTTQALSSVAGSGLIWVGWKLGAFVGFHSGSTAL